MATKMANRTRVAFAAVTVVVTVLSHLISGNFCMPERRQVNYYCNHLEAPELFSVDRDCNVNGLTNFLFVCIIIGGFISPKSEISNHYHVQANSARRA
jgi:hypothetical protein